MKRVNLTYGAIEYSLPKTSAATVKENIEAGLESGKPFWLTVNFGEGMPQPVELLLTSGVSIAIADVADVDPETMGISSEFPGMARTTADPTDFPYDQ